MFSAFPDWFEARQVWAALALAAWLAICWVCLVPGRERPVRQPADAAASPDWLVLYASQSGTARRLAGQLARCLTSADHTAALMALNELRPRQLLAYRRVLLVVSTYGEGEAPDNAAVFWRIARQTSPDLRTLGFAVLALGDRGYAGFCAFGQHLSEWFISAGARPLLPLQKVDRLDPETLRQWQQRFGQATGQRIMLSDDFRPWRLLDRQLLNAQSPGAPVWLIRLQPRGKMPAWQAGDLAQLRIGNLLRTYSVASLPEDGVLELIVRQVIHADGTLGRASGWLCHDVRPGDTVEIQLLPNPQFHLCRASAPVILIGAGTGIAGLRGLLRQHQRQGMSPAWLIFGERCQEHDRWLSEELELPARDGRIRLDRCFSRAPEQPEYVQDRLRSHADELRRWVDQGASIHVCGSLRGMGTAVRRALEELLTAEQWNRLQRLNRYRQDLY